VLPRQRRPDTGEQEEELVDDRDDKGDEKEAPLGEEEATVDRGLHELEEKCR
jgi:hypothetical protein